MTITLLVLCGLSLVSLALSIKSNLDKESIEFSIKQSDLKSDAVSHKCLQLSSEVKECMDLIAGLYAKKSKKK